MNDQSDCRRQLLTITLTVLCLLCGTNACDADARPDAARRAIAGAAGEEGDASSAAGTDTEPAMESDWCAAQQVLVAKCQRCHTAPPEHGAPFPLVTYDDTQVVNARGEARFIAIDAAVSKDYMPPSFITLEPPVAKLTEPERDVLLAWCRAGGLPAMRACEDEP